MSSNPPAQSKNSDIPRIVWWTVLPCLCVAAVMTLDFISKLPKEGPGIGDLLLPVAYIFQFLMFLVLLWTPILGITLLICTPFKSGRLYCGWRAWLVFVVLLIPFYYIFQISSVSPLVHDYFRYFSSKP